jgi:hypothetical protein
MIGARERAGIMVGVVVAVLVLVLIGVWATGQQTDTGPSELARAGIPVRAEDMSLDDPELDEEREEQGEGVERRVEAWREALRDGKAGQDGKRAYAKGSGGGTSAGAAAAAGAAWVGEIPIDTTADDWEPAIAADPSAGWVYVLTTRYGTAKPCPGNCPTPWISLTISSDGGATWAPGKPLCACKGSGQFDPIVEVVPGTGAVYALYMNGYNIMFTKSTDHGAHWSAPVKTYGSVSWNDKPVIAVSDNGQHVYISFNGPTGGDPWVAQSHDAGATWSQAKLVDSARYYFAFDADVASDGTVYFAESSLLYGGGGNKGTTPTGTIDEHVFISRDNGATWIDKVVGQTQAGIACVAAGCTPDFYLGHSAVTADAAGKLVYVYDGATAAGGKQSIHAVRSGDKGATWTAPVAVSTAGEEATEPMIEARGNGVVRTVWMETTGGGNVDAWNAMSRLSTDGGASWGAASRVSDATSGAAYKSPAGFAEVYGDYGEIAFTNVGKAVVVWGEGLSYTGPGGVWFNREP